MLANPVLAVAALAASLAAPAAAFAAPAVQITSAMFVERQVPQPGGVPRVVLDQPKSVPPGARLVFVLSYRNAGAPAANFVITDPVPAGVAFTGVTEGQAAVSVDGGRTYGPLAAARVRSAGGATRAASPEDVTHVRWTVPQIGAGAAGRVSFKGVVR